MISKMPLLFIGHGSPMNGIQNNKFTYEWKNIFSGIAKPKAILGISAHYLTKGTFVTANEKPPTIYDFGGFPEELYKVKYPAKGDISLANKIISLAKDIGIIASINWGLDHGIWTVLNKMVPEADIPVVQLSMDYQKSTEWHYNFAKFFKPLRDEGILIIGSGNLVHNLGMVDFSSIDKIGYGYDWAFNINNLFKQKISDGDHTTLINYHKLGKEAMMAIPSNEHFLPALYILGLMEEKEKVTFFNDDLVGGSLSMTSFKIC